MLLEGDASPEPTLSGPGRRYALCPLPALPVPHEPTPAVELPEAYGTQRLFLTARDPHWLYAYWDLSNEQQKTYNARSVDKHLVLRVYRNRIAGQPYREIHVHPESRNWFVHVGLGGVKFLGQLGYYEGNNEWAAISTSAATLTPPDTLSDDVSVWFETLPASLKHEQLLEIVKSAVSEHVPLMEAMQQLRAAGFEGLPEVPTKEAVPPWTPAQEKALASVITMDAVRRVWMGSLEITELVRRQLAQELYSAAAPEFSAPAAAPGEAMGEVSSVSSPFGGLPRKKGFWFNVNAELIIYGATEANATVAIGGRKIRLRPDGTFSYRFALPDGHYELPAVAASADGEDSRTAELRFTRSTQYYGHVERHPQDASLRPPKPEHLG